MASDNHPIIWRLIPPVKAAGSMHMAVDRWLLNQHRLGLQPSVLRFYTWTPTAISLGCYQRQWPDCWRRLTWQGEVIDVVRRPTGGRAVLHQGDLTYAIITSGLAGDRKTVYQKLCQFLIEGWRSLGVDLFYGEAGRGYMHELNCFNTATAADLVTGNGSKLVGSAQLRQDHSILQHGSIRLNPDSKLFYDVFGTQPQPLGLPIELSSLPQTVLPQVVVNKLIQAAQVCFRTQFKIQPLSARERQEALTDCSLLL